MPIVTRADGVDFAVYNYRELINAKKPSLLKQEIHILQEEQGNYAKLFPQATGDYETVFSRDSAYLLAEIAWNYFERPDDLIYCEALPDDENAILVVIRAGSIYLEAEVTKANLVDEFAGLITGNNVYDIYVYGDIPLAEEPMEGVFCFDKEFVKSFTRLGESTFDKLPIDEDLKLLPILDAIDELNLKGNKIPLYAAGIIAAIVFIKIAWDILKPAPPPPAPTVKAVRKPIDPYKGYKQVLKSPDPSKMLIDFSANIQQVLTIPGWLPTGAEMDGTNTEVEIKSVGGSTSILLAWAKQSEADLSASSGQAKLTLDNTISSRSAPTKIYNIRYMTSFIYDLMSATLPDENISLQQQQSGSNSGSSNYTQVDLVISFQSVSTDIIKLFAKELQGLPIVLGTIKVSIDDGLLSGSMTLTVLGAE